MTALVRREIEADRPAVDRVNELAFGQPDEARIVTALRSPRCISLVAEVDGDVVGHAFFTSVTIEGEAGLAGAMALGPMAVVPERQRQGIGSKLVRAGLEACRAAGAPAVFVLGHPGYYPRFGFEPADAAGFRCEWDVPSDVFLVVALEPGALRGRGGPVKYDPEFSKLD